MNDPQLLLQKKKSVPSCSEKQPAKKKRRYDSQYLSYGLTRIGDKKRYGIVTIKIRIIFSLKGNLSFN